MENDNEDKGTARSGLLKPPAGTPGWALSIAFLSSVVFAAFAPVYFAIAPELREYIKNKKEVDLAYIAANTAADKAHIERLLSTLDSCSAQVSRTAEAVGKIEQLKNITAEQLRECQTSLVIKCMKNATK